MLLAIAFILFAALMLSWLSMPEHGSEPMPVNEPARRSDVEPVVARA